MASAPRSVLTVAEPTPFRFPNGIHGTVDDDGKISILGRPAREDQRPSALSGPGATDPDEPSPLAKPTGRVYRGLTGDTNPLPTATGISAPPRDAGGVPDAPLIKEDPIGTAIAGGGALKAGAAAARAIPGVVGTAVEGATAAGVPALVETGDPKTAARAALAGAGVGLAAKPLAAARRLATTGRLAEAAPDVAGALADSARARQATNLVPAAINAGTRTAAAKRAAGAGDLISEAINAHPDLAEVINSGAGPAEKAAAIDSKLDELEAKNTAAHGVIASSHPEAVAGRLPVSRPVLKLQELAAKAHDAGDGDLRDAANVAIEKLKGFADQNGLISPEQVRGVRNKLAKSVAKGAGLSLSDVAAETATVKATLNDAISDLASETPDVGGKLTDLKARDRQIAGLITAKDSLEAQAGAEKLNISSPLVTAAKAVAHPGKAVEAIANKAPSVIDQHLASLAGPSGPAGVAALKAVALNPSRATLQAAVQAGITPQVALQVARLGAQHGATQ